MSINNTDPSILFGGTWEAWGSGKVPVGVDGSDDDFSTVEKTGGEKINSNLNCGSSDYGFGDYINYSDRSIVRSSALSKTHGEISAEISNLQPYITCYMWKRIS